MRAWHRKLNEQMIVKHNPTLSGSIHKCLSSRSVVGSDMPLGRLSVPFNAGCWDTISRVNGRCKHHKLIWKRETIYFLIPVPDDKFRQLVNFSTSRRYRRVNLPEAFRGKPMHGSAGPLGLTKNWRCLNLHNQSCHLNSFGNSIQTQQLARNHDAAPTHNFKH